MKDTSNSNSAYTYNEKELLAIRKKTLELVLAEREGKTASWNDEAETSTAISSAPDKTGTTVCSVTALPEMDDEETEMYELTRLYIQNKARQIAALNNWDAKLGDSKWLAGKQYWQECISPVITNNCAGFLVLDQIKVRERSDSTQSATIEVSPMLNAAFEDLVKAPGVSTITKFIKQLLTTGKGKGEANGAEKEEEVEEMANFAFEHKHIPDYKPCLSVDAVTRVGKTISMTYSNTVISDDFETWRVLFAGATTNVKSTFTSGVVCYFTKYGWKIQKEAITKEVVELCGASTAEQLRRLYVRRSKLDSLKKS